MKKYNFTKYLLLLLAAVFIPNMVSAANIYFETSKDTVSVGDTFIVKVNLDSENIDINSAEGNILIGTQNNDFIVNDFILAESSFTLWPQTPFLSQDGNSIYFAGGVPGGINANKINLFNIIIEASEEGGIRLSPENVIAFANDGQGTKIPVGVNDLIVRVDPRDIDDVVSNEWLDLVNQDTESPSVLLMNIGREASVFEGKRFAFFTAIDEQSGISHFEVSEDGAPVVKSGNMYALRNQDDDSVPNLVVTVYDNAGNKKTVTYKAPDKESDFTVLGTPVSSTTILPLISIVVVIILILLFSFIVRAKRKNKE